MHRFAPCLIAAGLLAVTAAGADAALIVRVADASAAPGTSVFVNVYLTNDTAAPDVSADSVNAYAVGVYVDQAHPVIGSGLGIATTTDLPGSYYAPQFLGRDGFFDLGDYRNTANGGDLAANQSRLVYNSLPADQGRAIANSSGNGLFQVAFVVPADALPGSTYVIRADSDPATSFSRPDGTLIDFGTSFGTVTVTPEPSVALLGVAAAFGLRRQRVR